MAVPRSRCTVRRYTYASVVILLLVALGACTSQSREDARLREILAEQVSRYPRMEVQDLYKFLYQAAMGSAHAVRDTAMVRDWLYQEIVQLDTTADREARIESLSPNDQLVRVHLRPYVRQGGDPEALLQAFIRTANEFKGEPAVLEHFWSVAATMCGEGRLPFSQREMDTFIAARREEGFPAVHHSEVYRQLYRPAYRVILRAYLLSAPDGDAA